MAGLGIGLLGAARITDKAVIDPARVVPQCRVAAVAARDRTRAEALIEIAAPEFRPALREGLK